MASNIKNSLKSQMLKITLIPLILMTIAIGAVSISVVRASITNQIQTELTHDTELISYVFDEFYDGDYSVEENEDTNEVEVYKGSQRLSGDNTLIGQMSNLLNIDVSIFIEDVRIMTTLKDADGNAPVGTQAAAIVKRDVIDTGKSVFYDNVVVYEEKSFAYYMPLTDESGSVIGMIGVCRSGEDVQKEVIKYVLPIVLVCVIAAIFFGIIVIIFNRRLADRIHNMSAYMANLAGGNFDAEMPREIMQIDDEVKALANDGKRMARSIKTLVEYDALTELNNRRSADKRLKEIRIKSVETGIRYCVCIADIDFFKKVNDTYGHEMGDEVLKMVASKLKKGMVQKGFSARWGGEEFLLIFESRELDIAHRELAMIMDDIRTIIIPGTEKQVTMSFGLTKMEPGESTDECLSRADANLYEAKETGRNQIVCK